MRLHDLNAFPLSPTSLLKYIIFSFHFYGLHNITSKIQIFEEVVDDEDNGKIVGVKLDGDCSGVVDEERSCC
jgi:hypothetical protein